MSGLQHLRQHAWTALEQIWRHHRMQLRWIRGDDQLFRGICFVECICRRNTCAVPIQHRGDVQFPNHRARDGSKTTDVRRMRAKLETSRTGTESDSTRLESTWSNSIDRLSRIESCRCRAEKERDPSRFGIGVSFNFRVDRRHGSIWPRLSAVFRTKLKFVCNVPSPIRQ